MKFIFVLVALISVVVARPQDAVPVVIVASESEVPNADDSYKFSFETADGVKREEEGAQKLIGEEEGATKRGSFSYSSPEGEKISLTFVADENGFQPEGAHLPVAPEPSPAKRALTIVSRTNAVDEAPAAGMSIMQKLMMLDFLNQRIVTSDENNAYNFNFERKDGTEVNERELQQKKVGPEPEDIGTVSRGSYSYTSPEGLTITMNWYADENSFQAKDAPILSLLLMPEYVVKMLADLRTAAKL